MNSDRVKSAPAPAPRLTERLRLDSSRHEATADILAVIWRYRWAVLLPAVLGAAGGYAVFTRTPETFKAHTRLMVESDRPPILDTMTGDVVGGIPSVDIIRSQLMSDRVVSMAYEDVHMQPFHSTFDSKGLSGIAAGSLRLTPELAETRSARSIVLLLSFENGNPELCDAAVKSFSEALQQFFSERHRSSRSELIQLIKVAKDQLHPEMVKLEQEYRDFRATAPLAWNVEGKAINPHRERQLFLIQKRSELSEKLRDKSILLASVESIAKDAKDPEVALNIIGQLLGVPITVPDQSVHQQNLLDGDEKLAQLQLDKQLIPLMVERNKFAAEFGISHPNVKQLDAELSLMKNELRRLIAEQSSRIVQLMKEGRKGDTDSKAVAQEAVNAVLLAARAEKSLLESQLEDLTGQIEDERLAASELARFEQDNTAMMREIERTRQLMNQIEEQMARVNLTEEEGGTRVIELTAATSAYQVGPNLAKSLGVWSCVGFAIGVGLALLLEKNANTFRDSDEVSEMLGIPVLTHLPFFRGRIKKAAKGEINPYKDLDPWLAVVHSPASVAAESIRSCRTSVFFELGSIEGGKILQVTSPLPGDGKSTIAGNLACSIAQSGKKVLTIDCDLRRPRLSDVFALADQKGLTDVLNGECEVHEACHATPLATLRVMPSGPIPANPAEAITLPDMSELLEELRRDYDYIIIDTPPLLAVTDPSITASMVDGVLMAMRVRRKSKPNARESVNILRAVGAKIIGIVINNSDEGSASDGYRGYGYYRYSRYNSRLYHRTTNSGKGEKQNATAMSPVHVSGRGDTPVRKPKADSKFKSSGDLVDASDVTAHRKSSSSVD